MFSIDFDPTSKIKKNRLTATIKSFVKFIDRKALDPIPLVSIVPGGATVPGRYSSQRPSRAGRHGAATRKNSLLQRIDISILSRGLTARVSRIKRPAAEFNALHVGYFAVPPCTTVKVHTGAHACACTHTHDPEIGRPARSIRLTRLGVSSYLSRLFVRSFAHAARIDKRKILPLCSETRKIRQSDSLGPVKDLHNTWNRTPQNSGWFYRI